MISPICRCVPCACLCTGNAVYAAKFGNQKPDVDANVAARARHPYVNMFRVVDVKDAVPKVSKFKFVVHLSP